MKTILIRYLNTNHKNSKEYKQGNVIDLIKNTLFRAKPFPFCSTVFPLSPDIEIWKKCFFFSLVSASDVITLSLIGHQFSMRLNHNGVEVFNAIDLKGNQSKFSLYQWFLTFNARRTPKIINVPLNHQTH